MEILRTENLSKQYGEKLNIVQALDNVNISVHNGEFISIVGSSGSGKVLYCICLEDSTVQQQVMYL